MRTQLTKIAFNLILSTLLIWGIGVQISCSGDDGRDGINGAAGAQGERGEPGTAGTQGEQGEGCRIADDPGNSAYLKMICGSGEAKTEETWPKALCGATAYDPAKMVCDKGILSFNFTDARDSKRYRAVIIGTQTWMAENLNYGESASSPLGRCYDDNPSNCTTYGRLYNWATAMAGSASSTANPSGVQGVCPSGWHIPSVDEWNTLYNYVDSPAGTKLKTTSGWSDNGNGTDVYGFSALPGGYYYPYNNTDNFSSTGSQGYWWSASEEENRPYAYSRSIRSNNEDFSHTGTAESSAISVRCLQD